MKVLLLDNLDSFTYNLAHLIEDIIGEDIAIKKNNEIRLQDIEHFDKIILSPGPGLPKDAGLMMDVLTNYASTKSILGVCLGHQAIAEHFGGALQNTSSVFHGIASPTNVLMKTSTIFKNIDSTFLAGRYHSWVVREESLPNDLLITAKSDDGYIMALQHKYLDIHSVQFHPESILTPQGKSIVSNFLYTF